MQISRSVPGETSLMCHRIPGPPTSHETLKCWEWPVGMRLWSDHTTFYGQACLKRLDTLEKEGERDEAKLYSHFKVNTYTHKLWTFLLSISKQSVSPRVFVHPSHRNGEGEVPCPLNFLLKSDYTHGTGSLTMMTLLFKSVRIIIKVYGRHTL